MFGTRMYVMHEQQEAVYYCVYSKKLRKRKKDKDETWIQPLQKEPSSTMAVNNILFFPLIIIYFVFFQIRTYNDNIRKQMHSKKYEWQKHGNDHKNLEGLLTADAVLFSILPLNLKTFFISISAPKKEQNTH